MNPIADTAMRLAQRMTLVSDLPGFARVSPGTIDTLTGHQGIDSPAWKRLDELVVQRLIDQADSLQI